MSSSPARRLACPDACADENEQRFDEGRERDVGADLAAPALSLEQRLERCREARLERAPFAQQDK